MGTDISLEPSLSRTEMLCRGHSLCIFLVCKSTGRVCLLFCFQSPQRPTDDERVPAVASKHTRNLLALLLARWIHRHSF